MNRQRLTGLGVIVLGLLLFLVIIPIGVDEPSNVEHIALAPQFWPKIIAVVIAAMGILLTVKQPESETDESGIDAQDWKSRLPGFLIAFSALLGFYFLIPLLGMVLPGMVLIFGLMHFAGERRFVLMLGIALTMPLLLYFFFVHVASIPIPLGVFESLRG